MHPNVMIHIFLVICLVAVVKTAFPNCPPGVTCPPGGLWSEWAVTGNPKCPTECGSCSKLFYTRRCLSAEAKCDCVGPTSKYMVCKTHICKYPSQRSCCLPHVSMLINGTIQCGPIPKDTTVGSGPCCKIGGIWSEWSIFAYDSDIKLWKRTRFCLSTEAGCPCTGSDTISQAQCPCPRVLKNAAICQDISPYMQSIYQMYNFWELNINDAEGTAYLNVAGYNIPPLWFCWTGIEAFSRTAGLVLLVPPEQKHSARCREDRVLDCYAGSGYNGSVTFTCDAESGYWRYDNLGILIEGYNQPMFRQAH